MAIYDSVSGNVLTAILAASLFLPCLAQAADTTYPGTVYVILGTAYENGTIVIAGIKAAPGEESYFPVSETGYSIELISGQDAIYKRNLPISFNLELEPLPGETLPAEYGNVKLDRVPFLIRIRYLPDAENVVIKNGENTVIYEMNLREEFCNKDNICGLGENINICPEDCLPRKTASNYQNRVIVMMALSAMIILIYMRFRKK